MMKIKLLALLTLIALSGCTDEDFKDIELGDLLNSSDGFGIEIGDSDHHTTQIHDEEDDELFDDDDIDIDTTEDDDDFGAFEIGLPPVDDTQETENTTDSSQNNFQGYKSTEGSKATINSIKGDVEYRPEGQPGWSELTGGIVLKPGDEISTGPDSEVNLTLFTPDGKDMGSMTVEDMSQIRMSFLLKQDNAIRAQVQLKLGKVSARINPAKTYFTDFTIKSPIATTSIRGTEFSVEHTEETNVTRIEVTESKVLVSSETGLFSWFYVEEGQYAEVGATGFTQTGNLE